MSARAFEAVSRAQAAGTPEQVLEALWALRDSLSRVLASSRASSSSAAAAAATEQSESAFLGILQRAFAGPPLSSDEERNRHGGGASVPAARVLSAIANLVLERRRLGVGVDVSSGQQSQSAAAAAGRDVRATLIQKWVRLLTQEILLSSGKVPMASRIAVCVFISGFFREFCERTDAPDVPGQLFDSNAFELAPMLPDVTAALLRVSQQKNDKDAPPALRAAALAACADVVEALGVGGSLNVGAGGSWSPEANLLKPLRTGGTWGLRDPRSSAARSAAARLAAAVAIFGGTNLAWLKSVVEHPSSGVLAVCVKQLTDPAFDARSAAAQSVGAILARCVSVSIDEVSRAQRIAAQRGTPIAPEDAKQRWTVDSALLFLAEIFIKNNRERVLRTGVAQAMTALLHALAPADLEASLEAVVKILTDIVLTTPQESLFSLRPSAHSEADSVSHARACATFVFNSGVNAQLRENQQQVLLGCVVGAATQLLKHAIPTDASQFSQHETMVVLAQEIAALLVVLGEGASGATEQLTGIDPGSSGSSLEDDETEDLPCERAEKRKRVRVLGGLLGDLSCHESARVRVAAGLCYRRMTVAMPYFALSQLLPAMLSVLTEFCRSGSALAEFQQARVAHGASIAISGVLSAAKNTSLFDLGVSLDDALRNVLDAAENLVSAASGPNLVGEVKVLLWEAGYSLVGAATRLSDDAVARALPRLISLWRRAPACNDVFKDASVAKALASDSRGALSQYCLTAAPWLAAMCGFCRYSGATLLDFQVDLASISTNSSNNSSRTTKSASAAAIIASSIQGAVAVATQFLAQSSVVKFLPDTQKAVAEFKLHLLSLIEHLYAAKARLGQTAGAFAVATPAAVVALLQLLAADVVAHTESTDADNANYRGLLRVTLRSQDSVLGPWSVGEQAKVEFALGAAGTGGLASGSSDYSQALARSAWLGHVDSAEQMPSVSIPSSSHVSRNSAVTSHAATDLLAVPDAAAVASVRLLARLFASQGDNNQLQTINHLRQCIKQAPSASRRNVVGNVLALLIQITNHLCSLGVRFKNHTIWEATWDICRDWLLGTNDLTTAISCADLRRASAEVAGNLCVLAETAQIARQLFVNVLLAAVEQFNSDVNSNPKNQVRNSNKPGPVSVACGAAFAIGCAQRAAGSVISAVGAAAVTQPQVLLLMCAALQPLTLRPATRTWALHALCLTAEAAGPRFSPHVHSVVQALLSVCARGACGLGAVAPADTVIQAPLAGPKRVLGDTALSGCTDWLDQVQKEPLAAFASGPAVAGFAAGEGDYRCLGAVANSLVTAIGPELIPGSSQMTVFLSIGEEVRAAAAAVAGTRGFFASSTEALQLNLRPQGLWAIAQLEYIRFEQSMILFAPQACDVPQLLLRLGEFFGHSSATVRYATVTCLRQLLQMKTEEFLQSSSDSGANMNFQKRLIKMFDAEAADFRLRRELRLLISSLVELEAPRLGDGWVELCNTMLMASAKKKQSEAAQVHPTAIKRKDHEGSDDSEDDIGDDDEGGLVGGPSYADAGCGDISVDHFVPRWRTKLLVTECVRKVLELHADSGIRRIGDLVEMAYAMATSVVGAAALQPAGILLLGDVVARYGDTKQESSPQDPALTRSVLEPHQAQISSALRSSLSLDHPRPPPSAVAAGTRVLVEVFSAPLLIQTRAQAGRLLGWLVSFYSTALVSSLAERPGVHSAVGTRDTVLWLNVLGAFAEIWNLAADSKLADEVNEEMSNVLSPVLSSLQKRWVHALIDFAALRFAPPNYWRERAAAAALSDANERKSTLILTFCAPFDAASALTLLEDAWPIFCRAIATMDERNEHAALLLGLCVPHLAKPQTSIRDRVQLLKTLEMLVEHHIKHSNLVYQFVAGNKDGNLDYEVLIEAFDVLRAHLEYGNDEDHGDTALNHTDRHSIVYCAAKCWEQILLALIDSFDSDISTLDFTRVLYLVDSAVNGLVAALLAEIPSAAPNNHALMRADPTAPRFETLSALVRTAAQCVRVCVNPKLVVTDEPTNNADAAALCSIALRLISSASGGCVSKTLRRAVVDSLTSITERVAVFTSNLPLLRGISASAARQCMRSLESLSTETGLGSQRLAAVEVVTHIDLLLSCAEAGNDTESFVAICSSISTIVTVCGDMLVQQDAPARRALAISVSRELLQRLTALGSTSKRMFEVACSSGICEAIVARLLSPLRAATERESVHELANDALRLLLQAHKFATTAHPDKSTSIMAAMLFPALLGCTTDGGASDALHTVASAILMRLVQADGAAFKAALELCNAQDRQALETTLRDHVARTQAREREAAARAAREQRTAAPQKLSVDFSKFG